MKSTIAKAVHLNKFRFRWNCHSQQIYLFFINRNYYYNKCNGVSDWLDDRHGMQYKSVCWDRNANRDCRVGIRSIRSIGKWCRRVEERLLISVISPELIGLKCMLIHPISILVIPWDTIGCDILLRPLLFLFKPLIYLCRITSYLSFARLLSHYITSCHLSQLCHMLFVVIISHH